MTCPSCGYTIYAPLLRRHEMRREIEIRSRFVSDRLDHKPKPAELMDLTEFMHGGPAGLLVCLACGLVIRDESQKASYSTDFYDPGLLQHLYPRYLQAFREKTENYQHLLSPHAELIEVGSHLGAFLEAAEESGWRPTGLDVGKVISEFTASRGLRVKREAIENTQLHTGSVDAIFVWNCFEQLEEPGAALHAAHALLKHHGLLVIRTPNFSFYRRARHVTAPGVLRALAYNNLLGFPYLVGYTPALLNTLLSRHGFKPVAGFESTLITMPFPDISSRIQRESTSAYSPYRSPKLQDPMTLAGPWIEIAYRRQEV